MSLRSLALAAANGESPATIESLAQEFLERYQSQVKLIEAEFQSDDKRAWFTFVLQNLQCDPIVWSDDCQRLALLSLKVIIRTGTELESLCTKEVLRIAIAPCTISPFQNPQ
jgi:hypothetical protein